MSLRIEPQYQAGLTVPLTTPTDDNTLRLVKAALHGLQRIYRPGFRYQKAGVMLMDLDAARRRQAKLYDDPGLVEPHSREDLMAALNAFNRRMGKGA